MLKALFPNRLLDSIKLIFSSLYAGSLIAQLKILINLGNPVNKKIKKKKKKKRGKELFINKKKRKKKKN